MIVEVTRRGLAAVLWLVASAGAIVLAAKYLWSSHGALAAAWFAVAAGFGGVLYLQARAGRE